MVGFMNMTQYVVRGFSLAQKLSWFGYAQGDLKRSRYLGWDEIKHVVRGFNLAHELM